MARLLLPLLLFTSYAQAANIFFLGDYDSCGDSQEECYFGAFNGYLTNGKFVHKDADKFVEELGLADIKTWHGVQGTSTPLKSFGKPNGFVLNSKESHPTELMASENVLQEFKP